jgi:hypothetical protein
VQRGLRGSARGPPWLPRECGALSGARIARGCRVAGVTQAALTRGRAKDSGPFCKR